MDAARLRLRVIWALVVLWWLCTNPTGLLSPKLPSAHAAINTCFRRCIAISRVLPEGMKISKSVVEFVATRLGFLCGMCLAFKKGMPSEIPKMSNAYHH